MIDALTIAQKRKSELEAQHTGLQQQAARSQQFLNELTTKIVHTQGRMAEIDDLITALSPPAPPEKAALPNASESPAPVT
jgi:chromosome segregation ATPase